MAAASGFTSLSPWTRVLYRGLLIAAIQHDVQHTEVLFEITSIAYASE